MSLTDAEIAAAALADETLYRLSTFTPEDAVAIGMSIRKRYMLSRRANSNKGLLISIRTIQGNTLFACSVGGGQSILGEDGWYTVEAMARVVRKTGHSTLYIEKGLKAMSRTLASLGIKNPPGYPQKVEGGGKSLFFLFICTLVDKPSRLERFPCMDACTSIPFSYHLVVAFLMLIPLVDCTLLSSRNYRCLWWCDRRGSSSRSPVIFHICTISLIIHYLSSLRLH